MGNFIGATVKAQNGSAGGSAAWQISSATLTLQDATMRAGFAGRWRCFARSFFVDKGKKKRIWVQKKGACDGTQHIHYNIVETALSTIMFVAKRFSSVCIKG